MTTATLEPRPLYGIGTVGRLTGLKPDTLRVWERRYGLGASHKSATGRRQYTQSDLEHLQLIAALVRGGARIGEIASSERKTLEMLVRQQSGGRDPEGLPASKPRALFAGVSLCEWLDSHQGCLSNVDARLARLELADLAGQLAGDLQAADVAVLECPNLGSGSVQSLRELHELAPDTRFIICYRFGNEHWLEELQNLGAVAMEFPPEPGRLAFEIAQSVVSAEVAAGEGNLGDLVAARERQFGAEELAAARRLKSTLDCECPQHTAELIEALASFEDYSASCSVDNWQDAAVHACIYAYTSQARHLMEKALQAVLETRGEEFEAALRKVRESKQVQSRAA